jgi:hypothetical protein
MPELLMFSWSVNDTSRVVRMTIIGDVNTLSVTSDDSRCLIYDCNILIMQVATGVSQIKLFSSFVTGQEAKNTMQV